jgi:hypothetical protein
MFFVVVTIKVNRYYVTITRFTRSASTVHSTWAAIVIALNVSFDCRQNGEARAGTSHHVRGCHRFQFWRAIKIIPNEKTFIYKTIAGRKVEARGPHAARGPRLADR